MGVWVSLSLGDVCGGVSVWVRLMFGEMGDGVMVRFVF